MQFDRPKEVRCQTYRNCRPARIIGLPSIAQYQKGSSSNASEKTISGCLSGPNDEGKFVLQTSSSPVELIGSSSDLQKQFGHEVKITGTPASGVQAGEKEEAGESKAEEQGETKAQEAEGKTRRGRRTPPSGQPNTNGFEHLHNQVAFP